MSSQLGELTSLTIRTAYSYLSISAVSIDGQNHDVQIYTDIGSEWLSGADTTQNVSWTTQLYDSGLYVHEASLLEKIPYAEIQDYSRDATVVYATNQVSCQSHYISNDLMLL